MVRTCPARVRVLTPLTRCPHSSHSVCAPEGPLRTRVNLSPRVQRPFSSSSWTPSLLVPFMSNEFCLLLGFRWDPSSPIASFFDHSVCFIHHLWHWSGFPGSSIGKESACQCRRHGRHGFDPWVGKVPWRKKWQPTAVFLPGKSHGQKSLVGYSPWCHKRVGHDLSTKPLPWHWSQTWILWLASYFKACVVWITKSVGTPLILFVSYWHTAWGRACPVSVAPLVCMTPAQASPSLLSSVWDKEGVSPSVQVRMRLLEA